ncbi:oligosaccharide MFS transporter [Salinimonas lutimaris]|uniref:oligosaccharide MFS transporter n=1 Tax=Salinimonas lutimaris TaxID=914153 RepID=UPI0010C0F215|nr:oligosaccharide MFS transporter [Salinimonas lutimaris]
MNQRQATYRASAVTFVAFFAAWSFAYSLFPLWLNQTVGLSGREIGYVYAANALAALFIMPFYGVVQDKLGTSRRLLFSFAGLMIFCGPFFTLVYEPMLLDFFSAGVITGAVYLALVFGAAVGALEAFIERISRQQDVEFGKSRCWGSLGWAAATFAAGTLFNISASMNFWLASLIGMGFFIAIYRLPVSRPDITARTEVSVHQAMSVFRLAAFWRLSVYVLGVACVYGVYDQQFPVYFASLFDSRAQGNAYFGYLNSFQVFLEAGMMFVAPYVVNKIGAKNGLLLSGVVMVLRITGSGVVDGPVAISFIKLLHALELPILLVAIFKYISIHFDKKLSATLYMVGFSLLLQAGAVALSPVIGAMYDEVGFANAYIILGIVVMINLTISAWSLEKTSANINCHSCPG